MCCVIHPWFALSTRLVAIAAAATIAAALPAQDRVRQLLERAVADLADPERAADATRQLENLGTAAVPVLCELVQARTGGATDTRPRAIYVLGRMGRAALPAVSALRSVLRGDDVALADDAAWALGALAPFFDEKVGEAVMNDLAHTTTVRFYANGSVLAATIGLGPSPTVEQLVNTLVDQPSAASRWIVARGAELGDHPDEVLAALVTQLDAALERPAIPDWRKRAFEAPDVALAWLALARSSLSARCARALLDHWQPYERERAIAWMHDNGAALPLRERADLVARLWDAEPRLVRGSAAAFAHWGRGAFVALPALRLIADTHQDVATSNACRDAAAAIVAACDELPPNDRAWIAAVDAILRGEAAAAPAKPCSRAGLDLIAEALYVAQWNDPMSLSRLLNLAESAGPIGPAAIQSVLGWLQHDRAATVELACAWLARRGTLTHKAWAEANPADGSAGAFERYLRWSCQYSITDGARRPAIEMLAHLLAAGAWDNEHALLLDDGNSRVVAHALAVALAERKGTLRTSTSRLAALVFPPASPTMSIVGAAWDNRTLPIDLGNHVRTLAAIALAELGTDYQVPPDLDDVVRQITGVPLAELGKHVTALRETNQLRALLDRIEDQCRLLMSVPPHLRWPSLAGTTR
jgi:hypothetical protein